VARVEIGGRRAGQDVWARWIDGAVQGDRDFLKVAGLDPDTRFEDPHAFVELIQALLDEGSATVVLDIPPAPEGAGGADNPGTETDSASKLIKLEETGGSIPEE
jgi:hypothetical protein